MTSKNETQTDSKPRLACYIRLTQVEHAQLERDALRSGRKPQALLKKAYFEKEALTILMADPDRNYFFTQLHRIGNNVNQIAKQLNSGFAFGFQQELETIRTQLTLLSTWATSKYRKNKTE